MSSESNVCDVLFMSHVDPVLLVCRVIDDMRRRGVPKGEEVPFGHVVNSPLAPFSPLTVVQPQVCRLLPVLLMVILGLRSSSQLYLSAGGLNHILNSTLHLLAMTHFRCNHTTELRSCLASVAGPAMLFCSMFCRRDSQWRRTL